MLPLVVPRKNTVNTRRGSFRSSIRRRKYPFSKISRLSLNVMVKLQTRAIGSYWPHNFVIANTLPKMALAGILATAILQIVPTNGG